MRLCHEYSSNAAPLFPQTPPFFPSCIFFFATEASYNFPTTCFLSPPHPPRCVASPHAHACLSNAAPARNFPRASSGRGGSREGREGNTHSAPIHRLATPGGRPAGMLPGTGARCCGGMTETPSPRPAPLSLPGACADAGAGKGLAAEQRRCAATPGLSCPPPGNPPRPSRVFTPGDKSQYPRTAPGLALASGIMRNGGADPSPSPCSPLSRRDKIRHFWRGKGGRCCPPSRSRFRLVEGEWLRGARRAPPPRAPSPSPPKMAFGGGRCRKGGAGGGPLQMGGCGRSVEGSFWSKRAKWVRCTCRSWMPCEGAAPRGRACCRALSRGDTRVLRVLARS